MPFINFFFFYTIGQISDLNFVFLSFFFYKKQPVFNQAKMFSHVDILFSCPLLRVKLSEEQPLPCVLWATLDFYVSLIPVFSTDSWRIATNSRLHLFRKFFFLRLTLQSWRLFWEFGFLVEIQPRMCLYLLLVEVSMHLCSSDRDECAAPWAEQCCRDWPWVQFLLQATEVHRNFTADRKLIVLCCCLQGGRPEFNSCWLIFLFFPPLPHEGLTTSERLRFLLKATQQTEMYL